MLCGTAQALSSPGAAGVGIASGRRSWRWVGLVARGSPGAGTANALTHRLPLFYSCRGSLRRDARLRQNAQAPTGRQPSFRLFSAGFHMAGDYNSVYYFIIEPHESQGLFCDFRRFVQHEQKSPVKRGFHIHICAMEPEYRLSLLPFLWEYCRYSIHPGTDRPYCSTPVCYRHSGRYPMLCC